jgi:hypothetical protein
MGRTSPSSGAVVILLLCFPALAVRGVEPAEVSTEVRIERSLLALDLLALKEERVRSEKARSEISEIYGRLDRALNGRSVALGTLETLTFELQSARGAEKNSADRISTQLERMQERLRRLALLEGESGGLPKGSDLLTGRWSLRIRPPERSGILELRRIGTVVSGTYRFEGEGAGSLRGTFSDGKLRLERIDSARGFDAVFEGQMKGDALEGTWMANELAAGKATRGEWSATRYRER